MKLFALPYVCCYILYIDDTSRKASLLCVPPRSSPRQMFLVFALPVKTGFTSIEKAIFDF